MLKESCCFNEIKLKALEKQANSYLKHVFKLSVNENGENLLKT